MFKPVFRETAQKLNIGTVTTVLEGQNHGVRNLFQRQSGKVLISAAMLFILSNLPQVGKLMKGGKPDH